MANSTIVAATMDMTVKLGITLPKSTILKIDSKRGDIPRSRFIRRAVESYLGKGMGKK
jgi:metal-responsive CopG/Arc/MetJ family transcriptional regulator